MPPPWRRHEVARILRQGKVAGFGPRQADVTQQAFLMDPLVGMWHMAEKQRIEIVLHLGTS